MRSQNRKLVVGVFDVFVWEGARLNRNRNSAFAKLVFGGFIFGWLLFEIYFFFSESQFSRFSVAKVIRQVGEQNLFGMLSTM